MKKSNKIIILDMMRKAPGRFVTMGKLAEVFQSHRAGARVWDLKKDGYDIEYVRAESGKWKECGYRLIFDAELDIKMFGKIVATIEPPPITLQEIDGQVCFV